RDPSKTISEIAETLNFPNDSFFCRFFKRETKQTPTQYRRTASEF
ncbi:MAG: helix-turn-helix domain-containing protein, partial [Bacteroidales bacterium]|nr:helix-turn-helix domain-containing protein [Bacteroidales bacterium]